MKLKNLSGRLVNKNVSKYRIDWRKKSRSKLQFEVKQLLSSLWGFHIVYEEFPVFGTKYTIDFYNANKDIAIEVQGRQHDQYNKFFHNGNPLNFGRQLNRDQAKRDFCEMNDITLVEILEEERSKLSLGFIREILDI